MNDSSGEYIFGKQFSAKIGRGAVELPDIGYHIPTENQNYFELCTTKLKQSDC